MHTLSRKIGKNIVMQVCPETNTEIMSVADVLDSWTDALHLEVKPNGLRPAQLGALYAIKSHWTVSSEPATIVMPTGTGKTETMIAAVVSEAIAHTIIVVPSNLLRKQTAEKFMKFGILVS